MKSFVHRTLGREIMLLVNSCSAHSKKESLLPLRNDSVKFLRSYKNCKLQPFTDETIDCDKAKHKRRHLFHVFKVLNVVQENIYNIDSFTAVRWVDEYWICCLADVVQNRFNRCFKQENDTWNDLTKDIDKSALYSMERDKMKHDMNINTDCMSSL